MSFDTARVFLDRYCDIENGCSISFFGGEPTLNMDLIIKVVNYCKAKSDKNKFSITTNGTTLSKKLCSLVSTEVVDDDILLCEWLDRKNFSMIISIDGDAESHDKYRITTSGKGSHSMVMDSISVIKQKCETLQKNTTLRGTFTSDITKSNSSLKTRLKFLNDIMRDGFGGNVSLEPVFLSEGSCIDEGSDISFEGEYAGSLEAEYKKATDWVIDELRSGKMVYWHQINMMIKRIVNQIESISECGAGCGYLSCSNDGDISACHRTHNSKIGNLKYGIDEHLRSKWVDNRWYSRNKCSDCQIRNICGGGCRESSLGASGDIREPTKSECEIKKIWIKCALYIIDSLGEEIINKVFKNGKN